MPDALASPVEGIPLLEDLGDPSGCRVLLRVDFNVPLDVSPGTGVARIADDFRLRAALPTIEWLTRRGAKVSACTHLGRPRGKPTPGLGVAPLRERLGKLAPGVELLENLRFDPGEEANSPDFVEHLVAGFDLYVNDAFGVSHREHASVVGPPKWLPSAAGRLLQREVEVLGCLLGSPERPFVALVGGSKVADKLGVIRSLLERVDTLLVGGGMAFTFLAAAGQEVGASLLEKDRIEECRLVLAEAGERLVLPLDTVALEASGALAGSGGPSGEIRVFEGGVPDGWRGLDIGPKTSNAYAATIAPAATVLWNGPMGVCEDGRFREGTRKVAEAVASSRAFSVVGGGDSVAALDGLHLSDRVSYVSTGGGASLELLEYGDLPGLAALRAASNAPKVKRSRSEAAGDWAAPSDTRRLPGSGRA